MSWLFDKKGNIKHSNIPTRQTQTGKIGRGVGIGAGDGGGSASFHDRNDSINRSSRVRNSEHKNNYENMS